MTGFVLLVVGPDADPTGSGAAVLDLLGWIDEQRPEVELHVLLLRGGPLIHRFHHLAPTTVVDWYDRRPDQRRAAAILRGPRQQRRLTQVIDRVGKAMLPRWLPTVPADVVLVCGSAALAAGPMGAARDVPRVMVWSGPDDESPRWTDGPVPGDNGRRSRQALDRAGVVLPAAAMLQPPLIWDALDHAVTR